VFDVADNTQLQRAEPRLDSRERHSLKVELATTKSDVLEAQRLRWRVFADELGARLPSREPGVDQDLYDPYCEHLLVRDEAKGIIVGTYRILSPEAARRVGGYYSEGEFDLVRLRHLRSGLVEIGRSCIHPDYRSGAVITLLWAGLAHYMHEQGHQTLIGCASIGMADGGHNAANLFTGLIEENMAPLEYRVLPRHRLPFERLVNGQKAEVPPLLKGYLRAGAWICGEPAWDPDFNTADLLVMLPMSRLSSRYAKHFIERQAA
jgi:putative hemolysin